MNSVVFAFFDQFALSHDGGVRLLTLDSALSAHAIVDTGSSALSSPATHPDTTLSPAEFSARVRALVPVRGQRFKDDHHDTCMYIERSKNLNVVAYTANYTEKDDVKAAATGANGEVDVNAKDPLRAYWIKIEPEHVSRRRARGEMEDICSLKMIERKLAYGCNTTALSFEKFVAEVLPKPPKDKSVLAAQREVLRGWHSILQPCMVKYVALPSMPVLLLHLPPTTPTTDHAGETPSFPPSSTVPVMIAIIDNQLSILEKVYVSSVEPKYFYQLPSVEYIDAFGVSLAAGKATYERKSK